MTQAFNLSQFANKVNTSGQASLTTAVTGTLPIANGGTNSTATPTAGGIVYGTGTAQAVSAAGTAGQILYSNGASAPSFAAPPVSGFSNMVVLTVSNANYSIPASRLKVTVVGGGGGSSVGGTSSFGSYCSATGGAVQANGSTFNAGGVGSTGNLNVAGQSGSIGYATCSGTGCTSIPKGTGGSSAFGLGRGANFTGSGGFTAFCIGGAGGGGSVRVISGLVIGDTVSVTVGASGGGDSTAGLVIIEY